MDKRNDNFLKIYLAILLLFLVQRNNANLSILKFSNITLKIKGIGERNILGKTNKDVQFKTELYPKEIYINGKLQNDISYKYHFNQTENIVELVWDEYITNTVGMFYGCSDITEIDLSNFLSSYVDDFGWMFRNCTSLTSINLSNFYTSNATRFNRLFQNCTLLTSVDLSKFNTSKVIWFHQMFEDCISLTSIDLSNFETTKAEKMKQMFKGCINLKYINMKNFTKSEYLIDGENNLIFNEVLNNIVVCIEEWNNDDIIISQLKEKECYSNDCNENWEINQKKIIEGINGCKCELDFCLSCPNIDPSQILCTKCGNDSYPIENDNSNNGEYHKCYKEPKGYYFDEENMLYKKCYESCETCEKKGNKINHNCLKCNIAFSYFLSNNNNFFNCYVNCTYYHYFDNEFNYYCTIDKSCPNEYPILIPDKMECIKNDINFLINQFKYDKNEPNKTKEIEYYDLILDEINKFILSEYLNLSNIDDGIDEIIKTEKMKITLTSTNNQKNNINNNVTSIYLDECEATLRENYNLLNNDSIYIKIIEINQEGMKIPKIEYDIYSKISTDTKLQKLNLSLCDGKKIIISIPVEIFENIDILNIKSGYYNDICYTAKSDKGTDISLKDRKNEFIENNRTLCQEDCDFTYYNYNTHKVNCSCKVKEPSSSFRYMKINKTKLLQNFIDIKNIANINIIFCYKNLFTKEGLINNLGNYIISSIIVFHIISIFIFYMNQLSKIKREINIIIFEIKSNIKRNNIIENIKTTREKNSKKNTKEKNICFNSKQKKKKGKQKNNFKKNINKYIKTKRNRLKKQKNISTTNKEFNNMKMNNYLKKDEIYRKKNISKLNIDIEKLKYDIDKLNFLSYNLALVHDKRTYCQYYLSLLKTNHILFFSFCYRTDYNSQIIKIDLFFVGFATFYTINALFFNDDTMHQIYVNNGLFDIEYQLPITIYSSLISMVLDSLLGFLALSNEEILELKEIEEKRNILKIGKKLKQKLNIKFFFYYFVSFILLLSFWYYISMFGAIYRNTQNHLLKDTLISFGLSMIYPFVLYLIPGFFRIPALSEPKKKRKCLYIFSQILQKIVTL